MERLYDDHAQALFTFLLNFTRNEHDTRDLLQDIFVKLACHPGRLDPARDERAFLIRMAHNAAVDLMRRRGLRERTREQFEAEPIAPLTADGGTDAREFRAALDVALGHLPPDQRAVVHLRLWEGLTFDQIAKVLAVPLHTAASRYRYGLDKLRARLLPLYEGIR